MFLRSYDLLNLPRAWRRVRTWAQGRGMDVPDRLPYELLHRLHGVRAPHCRGLTTYIKLDW